MTWFKIDDGFYDCDKVEDLEEEVCADDPELACIAGWLWTKAGNYGRKHDVPQGRTTQARIRKLLPVTRDRALQAAKALVECKLWYVGEDGAFYFNRWEKYGPIKSEDPEHVREGNRQRQRAKRARDRQPDTQRDSHSASQRDVTHVTGPVLSRPDQTDPDQTRDPPNPPRDGGRSLELEEPPWEPSLGERMRTRFQAAWLAARHVEPAMGGKRVGGFAGRVQATADAQGMEPMELFERCLQRFLGGSLDAIAKRSPYAALEASFGDLADRGHDRDDEDPAQRKAREIRKASEDAEAEMRAGMAAKLGVQSHG